jgi:hypothetical protein
MTVSGKIEMSAAECDRSQLEPKEVIEVLTVDDPEFEQFIETNPNGLAIVPALWREYPEPVLPPNAGDFAKWLRAKNPSLSVQVIQTDKRLLLHSGDYWLPLVFLASDVSVQIYLNMVASFLYDKLKGALKGEPPPRVHLSAEYVETPDGTVIKRFNFDGDMDALDRAKKLFDANKFLK